MRYILIGMHIENQSYSGEYCREYRSAILIHNLGTEEIKDILANLSRNEQCFFSGLLSLVKNRFAKWRNRPLDAGWYWYG